MFLTELFELIFPMQSRKCWTKFRFINTLMTFSHELAQARLDWRHAYIATTPLALSHGNRISTPCSPHNYVIRCLNTNCFRGQMGGTSSFLIPCSSNSRFPQESSGGIHIFMYVFTRICM